MSEEAKRVPTQDANETQRLTTQLMEQATKNLGAINIFYPDGLTGIDFLDARDKYNETHAAEYLKLRRGYEQRLKGNKSDAEPRRGWQDKYD